MKKILLFLTILPLFLNAQVPNAGFENWSIQNGEELPDDWTVYVNDSGTVGKSTDHVEGDYSLFISSGDVFDLATVHTQFSVDQVYHKLKGQFNIDSSYSGGSAIILVNAWDDGSYLNIGVLAENQTTQGFVPFELDLTYSAEPYDSIRVSIQSGSLPIPNGISIGYADFKIDALALVDTTTTSLYTISKESNALKLFPNPVSNNLTIDLEISDAQAWKIFDQSGRLVGEEEMSGQRESIQVGHLSAGVYMLMVYSEEGKIYRKKFVKL